MWLLLSCYLFDVVMMGGRRLWVKSREEDEHRYRREDDDELSYLFDRRRERKPKE